MSFFSAESSPMEQADAARMASGNSFAFSRSASPRAVRAIKTCSNATRLRASLVHVHRFSGGRKEHAYD